MGSGFPYTYQVPKDLQSTYHVPGTLLYKYSLSSTSQYLHEVGILIPTEKTEI